MEIMRTRYENSLFFQINSSAKYFEKLFEQFFKEANIGVSATEHLALTTIYDLKKCCQRDLAKILLKDRANTGKLAKSLEEKGLVKITPDIRNNKPVKILSITKKGATLIEDSHKLLKPLRIEIEKNFTDEKLDEIKNSLKSFKETISKALKTNI